MNSARASSTFGGHPGGGVVRAPRARRRLPLIAALLMLMPVTGRAQYIGREPERLVSLLDLSRVDSEGARLAAAGDWQQAEAAFRRDADQDPEARLGVAVALFKQGKARAGLDQLTAPGENATLRYARVLLRLHTEPDLRFPDLRSELAELLKADPFFRDAFDVWLGLNPKRKELQGSLEILKPLHDARAAWQRAEVWLRLGNAGEAERALRDIDTADPALRNRADRALARAEFQSKADAAGDRLYQRLLGRLDDVTANLLFQDVAAIASRAEREEFARLAAAAPEKKAEFFRQFWAMRHPVPIQEVNPRLAEHYRRLAAALDAYGLQSNGRGFFTDPDVFRSYSPALPYFDSTVVFDDGPASRYWLDPRGLLLIRHGESDVRIPPRSVAGTEPAESWMIGHYGSAPLFFHFVNRPAVGEWTRVLNLAVAATPHAATADDPARVLENATGAAVPLYESRLFFHSLYQRSAQVRSRADFEDLLRSESELMAAYLKTALAFDSTSYYTKDNTLPMIVSVSNFYAGGKPALEVQFATDLSGVDARKLGPASSLEARVMLYDRHWTTVRRQVEKAFPLQAPASGKFKGFVGRVPVLDLDPEDYRMALFISQRESGRIGLARGRHEVTYVHDGNLGLSDLILVQQPRASRARSADTEDGDRRWMPVPTRVVHRSIPFRLEFELYNLRPDKAGTIRYEVEERVLTLYEQPGFLGKLAGYGNLLGQIFFPLYTFAGQVGGSVLSQATASETAGLQVAKRLVDRPASDSVSDDVKLDLKDLKPGVYTVYVTVRDLRTREITSRLLTFQIEQ